MFKCNGEVGIPNDEYYIQEIHNTLQEAEGKLYLCVFQMSMGMTQTTESMSDPNGYHQQNMYQDHNMGLSVR